MLHQVDRTLPPPLAVKSSGPSVDVDGLAARVETVWAEWRRLNDEAQQLHDDLYAEESENVVRAGIPRLRAYEEAINAVMAKGEALHEEYGEALQKVEEERDAAAALFEAAVETVEALEDRITDVTYTGIEPDIDGAISEFEAWLDDPAENPKSAPARRAVKAFLDGLTPEIQQAVAAADGGEALLAEYEALAFEMDALDNEIAAVTAEIDAAQAAANDAADRAEAESGRALDPAERAALFAEADRLLDEKDNLLAAREELLAEAARIEGDMLAAIS